LLTRWFREEKRHPNKGGKTNIKERRRTTAAGTCKVRERGKKREKKGSGAKLKGKHKTPILSEKKFQMCYSVVKGGEKKMPGLVVPKKCREKPH